MGAARFVYLVILPNSSKKKRKKLRRGKRSSLAAQLLHFQEEKGDTRTKKGIWDRVCALRCLRKGGGEKEIFLGGEKR